MPENIGFIGLGNMGEAIAANLLAAGHSLKVYNRTASKAAPLKEKGATVVPTAAEVASQGGIVFTMLSDDRAVEEVCSAQPSVIEKLGNGGVHVSLSTIAPATAKRLAEHHRQYGVDYVGSPVFGRPDAAAAKRLFVCVSGPASARDRVRPLLAAIGQGTTDFGEDPGAAHVVKLCGNFMIFAAIEALCESLALAEKNGADPAAVAAMLSSTLFACPVYQTYAKVIMAGNFQEGKFRLVLGLKDVNLALQTAAASEMPLPTASLLRDRLLTSVAKGRGEWDWTAVALDVAEDSGLRKAAAR
jgi:3-hydroxyisobutyrate dehydrogenase-like beta-hydroxyacid dehydrogenase